MAISRVYYILVAIYTVHVRTCKSIRIAWIIYTFLKHNYIILWGKPLNIYQNGCRSVFLLPCQQNWEGVADHGRQWMDRETAYDVMMMYSLGVGLEGEGGCGICLSWWPARPFLVTTGGAWLHRCEGGPWEDGHWCEWSGHQLSTDRLCREECEGVSVCVWVCVGQR